MDVAGKDVERIREGQIKTKIVRSMRRTVPIFQVRDFDSLPDATERSLPVPFTVRSDTTSAVRGSDAPCTLFAVLRNNARLVQLVADDTLVPMPPWGAAAQDPAATESTDVVLVKSPVLDAKLIDVCRLEAEPAAPEPIIGVAYFDKPPQQQ
jgi:hypothetical protein